MTDDFAETISLGPATDGEPDDDWVLSFTPEDRIGSYNQLFECTRPQLRRSELMHAFFFDASRDESPFQYVCGSRNRSSLETSVTLPEHTPQAVSLRIESSHNIRVVHV
jgi:hypothetical protein